MGCDLLTKSLSTGKEMLLSFYQDLFAIKIITQGIYICIQNSGKSGFDYYILVCIINYGDHGPIHCQQHNVW